MPNRQPRVSKANRKIDQQQITSLIPHSPLSLQIWSIGSDTVENVHNLKVDSCMYLEGGRRGKLTTSTEVSPTQENQKNSQFIGISD